MPNKPPYDLSLKPTQDLYDELQQAYEYLNWALFDDELPNCLITLRQRQGSYGYFSGNSFQRKDGRQTDEIAINPFDLKYLSTLKALAALTHGMGHLWQHRFGSPGRGGYHNRELATKMKSIGLQPTSTGEPDGQETGDGITHLVIPDGLFERRAKALIAKGFAFTWTASASRNNGQSKSGKRVKYTCPHCKLNAWSKHDATLMCGTHRIPMLPE